MGIWILNGLTVDVNNVQTKKHILVENDKIAKVIDAVEGSAPQTEGHEVIDAAGKLVTPGFIDMHVHLREPGFEHKENIATGTRSAARGGFTTIACMPNTRPVIDTVDTVNYILDKAATEGVVRVLPYGTITKNELGRELTDFAALKEAGVIGYTDDGVGVQSAQMMKDAMALAASIGMPIIAHCEDDTLVVGAPVSEGTFAKKHGLKGIPNESEAIHVGRDVLLAEATGVHYHVCHVSTEQSVRLIRHAKQFGIKVTAEVCPHHLVLSDEDIPGLDANWKMNPPLRTPRDVQAVIEGSGRRHNRHHRDGSCAAYGRREGEGHDAGSIRHTRLRNSVLLCCTRNLLLTGKWTLGFLVDRMTKKPADVFGLPYGTLEVGSAADITIVDLETEREVLKEEIVSRSKNTPFIGWKLQGWPVVTIASGKVVWS